MNLLAIALGFCLDIVLADPAWMPHPVVWMGRFIALAEKLLRKVFPKTPMGERAAGVFLVLALLSVTGVIAFGAITLATFIRAASAMVLAGAGIERVEAGGHRCLSKVGRKRPSRGANSRGAYRGARYAKLI